MKIKIDKNNTTHCDNCSYRFRADFEDRYFIEDYRLCFKCYSKFNTNENENVAGKPNAFDRLFESLPEKDKLRM